jgi:hypothetical protein
MASLQGDADAVLRNIMEMKARNGGTLGGGSPEPSEAPSSRASSKRSSRKVGGDGLYVDTHGNHICLLDGKNIKDSLDLEAVAYDAAELLSAPTQSGLNSGCAVFVSGNRHTKRDEARSATFRSVRKGKGWAGAFSW